MNLKKVHRNVIHKALVDPKFGKEIFSQLPLEPFDSGVSRELVQIIKRYYISHTKSLDQESLLLLAERHVDKRNLKDTEADDLFRKIDQAYTIPDSSNEDILEESVQRFVRKSLSIQAIQDIMSSKNLEDEGAVEELSDKLREIAVIDAQGSVGGDIDFFDDFDKRVDLYQNMHKQTYPTGFSNLDELLRGGGLSAGQLAVLIAGTGSGKSTLLIQLITSAVKSGLNAMFISLEEHDDQMTARIETNLLGKNLDYYLSPTGDLNLEKYKAIESYYEQMREQGNWGDLYIKTRLPYSVTIEDIEQMIVDTKVRKGENLDIVVVDYPEIMKKRSSNTTRDEDIMGELFHKIGGLGNKYGFVVWTVAQTNRTAGSNEVVTAHNIQGAYKVTNSADLILTVNRTQKEMLGNCLRMNIDKIRYPNPQAIRPDFLYFKTLTQNGYQVVPETDTEIAHHRTLLTDSRYISDQEEHLAANYGKALVETNENLAFS